MSRGQRGGPAFVADPPFRSKVIGRLIVFGLLVAIAAAAASGRHALPGFSPLSRTAFERGSLQTEANTGRVTITLYFADEDASMLVPEVREVARDPAVSVAYQAMAELAKGPSNDSGLVATIPADARVGGVDLTGEVATVDWNDAFVEHHWGGSSGEWLTIRSIVATMSQFDGVRRIQLLVEGEPIETLAGHFEIDHSFSSERPQTTGTNAVDATDGTSAGATDGATHGATGSAGATDGATGSAQR